MRILHAAGSLAVHPYSYRPKGATSTAAAKYLANAERLDLIGGVSKSGDVMSRPCDVRYGCNR